MLNTSVLDINSTLDPFNFKVCFNGIYVGMFVFLVAESLCFTLGTLAHSWFLWLSLRDGWKIKTTQVFPLNMTIMELVYSIECAVEILSFLIFNETLWDIMFIVLGLPWVGRPLIQICICVEQYLAVIHPIMFLKYKALQYRIVCAAVVWLIAVACPVFEGLIQKLPYHIFNSVFIISVTINSFCCVSVLRALKQPGPGDTQISMEKGRDVGNQQKRNAFNTIFSGLLIILFTYLPQVSLIFINESQIDLQLFNCNIFPIMTTFNVLGVMITPFLKIYKNTRMKCLKH